MSRKGVAAGFVALALSIGVAAAGPLEDAQAANRSGDYPTALQLFRSLACPARLSLGYRRSLVCAALSICEGCTAYRASCASQAD